jgi:hypothetical protein
MLMEGMLGIAVDNDPLENKKVGLESSVIKKIVSILIQWSGGEIKVFIPTSAPL